MKKLFSIFALAMMLSLSVAPVVLAGTTGISGPPDGCVLRHAIKMPDASLLKNDVVGVDGAKVTDGATEKVVNKPRQDWGLVCVIDKVYSVVDWIYWIVLAIAGIVVLWGAFTYITAQGDPGKIGKAKGLIGMAIGGLLIAIFAKAIPSIVIAIFG